MRFLLDENVHRKLLIALAGWGHDAVVIGSGSKDKEVAEQSKRELRIVLTHDVDFLNASLYPFGSHGGIVVIRLNPARLDQITKVLQQSLSDIPEGVLANKTWILYDRGLVEATES